MKRLCLPAKLFIRHKDEDFEDDGTHFRVYYYKDALPVSVTHWNNITFIDIRLDYLRIPWETYKEDGKILGEFNGSPDERFDLEKLIANCEYIAEKYGVLGR